MFLNGLNVTCYKTKFATSKNMVSLLSYFEKCHRIYQYVYNLVYTKYFIQNQKCRVDIRVHFMLHFKVAAVTVALENLVRILKIERKKKLMSLSKSRLRQRKVLNNLQKQMILSSKLLLSAGKERQLNRLLKAWKLKMR